MLEGASGGYKEIIMRISGGDSIYGTLKYESGVHRVQRVPATETQGRVHTSAATVAVLPEAEPFDVTINEGEIRWDTFRSGGAGGQNVNKVESGVRLRYKPGAIPTPASEEILIECTETRDQPKNKERALSRLRSFIYDREHRKYTDEIASRRKSLVSTGDRSAKIRTYNFPQARITDHRINYTAYNLRAFLDGDIQELIDKAHGGRKCRPPSGGCLMTLNPTPLQETKLSQHIMNRKQLIDNIFAKRSFPLRGA